MKSAISIDRISKLYHLGACRTQQYRTIRETIVDGMRAPWRRLRRLSRRRRPCTESPEAPADTGADQLWAVKDISFEVNEGDVVGIIGRNGAGKSTLLKILSRITEPTSGQVRLRGRIGSLLEVGTGFHHELTGRENIFLNGAILGMSRQQIARRFDEIVAFAEVDQFLDTPVKRYSSGMFVRLAFAVASHMDPEVLIVDEVLAVGDAAFQKKCLGKMDEVSHSGRTVLFVSHNMATILNLCQKVAVLERGRLAFVGECQKGVEIYTRGSTDAGGGDVDLSNHPRRRPGNPPILGRVRMLNSSGRTTDQIICGEPIMLEVDVAETCVPGDYHFAIGFDDNLGVRLFTVATYLSDSLPSPTRGMRRLICKLDQVPLAPGRYALTLNAGPRQWVWTDMIDQALWFDVTASDFYGNGRLPNPDWGRFLVRSHWQGMEHNPE